MTDSQYPGVVGATDTVANRYQSVPQHEFTDEKTYDGQRDWRDDIAEAQKNHQVHRRARCKRVLLGMAAAAVLLTPMAFIGLMRHHRGHNCQHNGDSRLNSVSYGQLGTWLGQINERSCDHQLSADAAEWYNEGTLAGLNGTIPIPPVFRDDKKHGKHGKHGKHDHDKKKKKDKWVAFNGNGQFYVDPANWNQLDFTVKACHSWAWVTVGHEAAKDPPKEDPPTEDPPSEDPPKEDPPSEDPPKEDPPSEDPPKEDPPSEDPPSGDLLLNIPSSPVIPEFFKQLEGDDDGGDDKDHQNDIVVTFKAYLADEKLQDTVRVVEEQNEEGQYSWRLETVQGDKDHEQLDNDKEHPKPPPHHPGHPHPPHHHPKHPKHPKHSKDIQVVVKLHIQLPSSLSSLDALRMGIRTGAIHVPSLKDVQLGDFKAGAVMGRVHVGEVNAVSSIELGTVAGAVILYKSQAELIKVGSVSGLVHVTSVSSRETLEVGTVSGDVVVHHADASDALVKAGSVSGTSMIVDVLAGRFYAGSASGPVSIYANVSETARVKTVSGHIRGHINYVPHEDEEAFQSRVFYDEAVTSDVVDFTDMDEPATILARAVSGDINLYVAHGYKGPFELASIHGKLSVNGPRVHVESETRFGKKGYVGDEGDSDNGQLVSARSVNGAISVKFD